MVSAKEAAIGDEVYGKFSEFDFSVLRDKELFAGWQLQAIETPHGVEFTKQVDNREWSILFEPDTEKIMLRTPYGGEVNLSRMETVKLNKATGEISFLKADGLSYEISDRGHSHKIAMRGEVIYNQYI